MVFTAYFDESGTHRGADISGMAGFVGNARQWRKFEKRAGKLFKRFRVDVFHTIDVRRADKDFDGWTVDRKIEFLDEFQHVINETLESGVASFIRSEDYEYYSKLEWPKRTRRDSKYTLLFRACLSQIIDTVAQISQLQPVFILFWKAAMLTQKMPSESIIGRKVALASRRHLLD